MEAVKEEDSQSPKEQKALVGQQSHSTLVFPTHQNEQPLQLALAMEASVKAEKQSSSAFRSLRFQPMPMPDESSMRAGLVDVAYDADVEETAGSDVAEVDLTMTANTKVEYLQREREHIYELFQPWALKTYGDQAKTKTITLRKKARILKALEGKEHSLPDSSKFRFWVKTKGFTTKRPEGFEETPGNQRRCKPLPPNSVPSDNPKEVDLFVASTQKEHGRRTYKKVAVIEEFFDIIYSVHMELGGRSGMHAGQKRTYRIITETYGFLPREAVTRFLSICPECKKNLRAVSPAASSHTEEPANESSSEVEALNYSTLTECSLEAGNTIKTTAKWRRYSTQDPYYPKTQTAKVAAVERMEATAATTTAATSTLPRPHSTPTQTALAAASFAPNPNIELPKQSSATVPRIRVNPHLQRPLTPPLTRTQSEPIPAPAAIPSLPVPLPQTYDMNTLKTQQNLFRYYEFMRRFYTGGLVPQLPEGHSQQQTQEPQQQHRMSFPFQSCGNGRQATLLENLQIFPDLSKIPATTGATTSRKRLETAIECDVREGNNAEKQPKLKKLKTSPESSKSTNTPTLTIATTQPQTSTPTRFSKQISAINLCKPFLFRSNGSSPAVATTAAPTASLLTTESFGSSTPLVIPMPKFSEAPCSSSDAIKMETPTSPRAHCSTALQIPQFRSADLSQLPPLDLERLKPITSTYLQLTRSMGLSDEDALRFDNLETIPAAPTATDTTAGGISDATSEADAYAGLMKDADKLKLMLLAWNYQNSNAVRNGTEGPDLSVVGGLWAQYQNALAQNAAAVAASTGKLDASLSPVPRTDANSPMEAQDETNSSGQKEEDEGSEDDSDDKLDEKLTTHDPERLKAFNMFVRLFVDENLDRIVPISKQPKEKIQAIIDSCARQFPEFSDRSRKRIRTYLKSCRRNKKTRDGWDNTTRPTPAHLTSVQAEQILAIACENESMNAKRMRIGLEPITHAIPAPGSAVAAAAAAVLAATSSSAVVGGVGAGSVSSSSTATSATIGGGNDGVTAVTSSALPFTSVGGTVSFARSTPNSDTAEPLSLTPAAAAAAAVAASSSASGGINSARSSPLALSSNASGSTSGLDMKPLGGNLANGSNGAGSGNIVGGVTNGNVGLSGAATSPLYRPTDFTSPSVASPFVAAAAAVAGGRGAPAFPGYFPGMVGLGNATPTDLSMKAATSVNISNNNNIAPTTVTASNVNSNLLVSSNNLLAGLNASVNAANNNNALVTATQQLQQLQQQQQQQLQQQGNVAGIGLAGAPSTMGAVDNSAIRPPPLLPHKLSQNEVTAARQVISAYRESAAFLLRTADQVEQLLVQQQQQ